MSCISSLYGVISHISRYDVLFSVFREKKEKKLSF